MKKLPKKLLEAKKLVDSEKFYSLEDAIKLAQETSYAKFDASIDMVLNLNLDVRQADQQLRGSVSLPHGTGKTVRVLAATDDAEQQSAATTAGADIVVGAAELQEILNSGNYEFDIIVAHPKMMPTLGRFGRQLGPKGLMPNPKTGTVTPNVGKAVTEIKKGKANYRTDKNGIVHTSVGKKSMDTKALFENASTILELITKLKPSTVKGSYITNFTVSSTMGPSIKVAFEK